MLSIDPHVHCRDGKEAYKETIEHVLKLADELGIGKIFDMPNTDPPIIMPEHVEKRLKLVPKEGRGRYFLYVGATAGEKQLRYAVDLVKGCKEVVGIKLYAGKSVRDLAVTREEEQREIYTILADYNYRGVIAVHCEKEDYIHEDLFDPEKPYTHSVARPKKAEIESVKDQIKFVKESKFKGNLHICHVSCPESVKVINNARKEIKITCAVTPHHILFNSEIQKQENGLLYKVNPPLREEKDVLKLRKYLQEGMIDWIETDHAPHTIGEKLFGPYPSGFPSMDLYGHFLIFLLRELNINWDEIDNLTRCNIEKTFDKRKWEK